MDDKERTVNNETELDENTLQDDDIHDIERRIQALEERIGSMRKEEVLAENKMIEEDNKNAETDLLENAEAPETDETAEDETVETNDPEEEPLTEEESSLVITEEMMDALNESDESVSAVTEESEETVQEDAAISEEDNEASETETEEDTDTENAEEPVEEIIENAIEETYDTEAAETTEETEEITDAPEATDEAEEEPDVSEAIEDNEEELEETSVDDDSEETSEEEIPQVDTEDKSEETAEEELERTVAEEATEPEHADDLKSQIEAKLRDVEEQSNLLLEYLAEKMSDTRDSAAMVYDNVKHDLQEDVEDMRIRNGLTGEETVQAENETIEEESTGNEVSVTKTIPEEEQPETAEVADIETGTAEEETDTETITEETETVEEEPESSEEQTEAVKGNETEESGSEETAAETETAAVEEETETTPAEKESTETVKEERPSEEEKAEEEKTVETESEKETESPENKAEEQGTEETPETNEIGQTPEEETEPEATETHEEKPEEPVKKEEVPETEKEKEPDNKEKEPEKTGHLSNRQYMFIAILAVLLALGVSAYFMFPAMKKNGRYQEAIQQMERGEYDKAYESLDGLSGYKDADRYITYCDALKYYHDGELDQAIDAFSKVSDLGQAGQYVSYINAEKIIAESISADDFDKAAGLFEQAGNLLDSKAMAEYCQGITAFLNNQNNAKDLLKKIADKKAIKETYYSNAADLLRYIDAGVAFDNDDPDSYDTLRELAAKEGSFVSRMKGAYTEYVKGLDCLDKELYFSAYSCFKNSNGLKDAEELAESCFQARPFSGILYRNASSGSVEITVYDTNDDKDMYLKIYDENNELVESLYIRDGESATAYFQGGSFRMAVAYGENGWWFGPEESFGTTGTYQRLLLNGVDEYYEFPSGASYTLRFDVDDGNVNHRSSDYGDF